MGQLATFKQHILCDIFDPHLVQELEGLSGGCGRPREREGEEGVSEKEQTSVLVGTSHGQEENV